MQALGLDYMISGTLEDNPLRAAILSAGDFT